MNGRKDDSVYLRHILKCIETLHMFSAGKEEWLIEDPLVWNATLRQLQIMAESATKLSGATKVRMESIDWVRIRGFRNLLVHDYLGDIDPIIIRGVLKIELPKLEAECNRMLGEKSVFMRIIELDAAVWKSPLDFYNALLLALGSPEGHGRSVDALLDSMVWGGMNSVEPPYSLRFINTKTLSPAVKEQMELLKRHLPEQQSEFLEQKAYDVDIRIEIFP